MTGEMSNPVDRDEWPLQAAIADATDGELRAFDVYQGPYVLVLHGPVNLPLDESLPVQNGSLDRKDGYLVPSVLVERMKLLANPAI